MHTDVVDLLQFYQTSVGHVARRMIRRAIRQVWPDLRGLVVAGFGYSAPYLRPFAGEAERIIALMPAGQGVVRWPSSGPAMTVLTEEAELPLPDLSVDRLMLVHSVEATERLPELMPELWRVLAGGGRLLSIVPNRRGIWARLERTPFGHGHPYSASQLSRMLRHHHFLPERSFGALFVPPFQSRFLLRAAPAWEQAGGRWFSTFSGVVMIEASKQLYRINLAGSRKRRPRLIAIRRPAQARDALGRLGAGDGKPHPVRRLAKLIDH